MVLWMVCISAIGWAYSGSCCAAIFIDIGPLIYFYVLKLTRPQYKFRWKDLLHFIPLLLEQGVLVLQVKESIKTGIAGLAEPYCTWRRLLPYLYWCVHRLIERFYQRMKFNEGDRYRYELRWLHRLLKGFGLLWLLWIPFTVVLFLLPSAIRHPGLLSFLSPAWQ
jgi:putative ABC transport system permease protein